MRMVHCLKHKPPLWRFFTQENVVPIDSQLSYLALFRHRVSIAVECPGVENDEPANVLRVEQLVKLPFPAAPRFSGFSPRDKSGSNLSFASNVEWDLVAFGYRDDREFERWKPQPPCQVGARAFASQRMWSFWPSHGLEVALPRIGLHQNRAGTCWKRLDEAFDCRWLPWLNFFSHSCFPAGRGFPLQAF